MNERVINSVFNKMNLRCLQDIRVRGPAGSCKDKLEPRKEVWSGDKYLDFVGVEMVPEAMGVDDITQR